MYVRSALILILLALAAVARAQEPPPRVEAGPDVALFHVQYWPNDVGGGAHVTVALTPLIAIETRVRAFTNEPLPSLNAAAGRSSYSAARARHSCRRTG